MRNPSLRVYELYPMLLIEDVEVLKGSCVGDERAKLR